jgi:hypothetical protein
MLVDLVRTDQGMGSCFGAAVSQLRVFDLKNDLHAGLSIPFFHAVTASKFSLTIRLSFDNTAYFTFAIAVLGLGQTLSPECLYGDGTHCAVTSEVVYRPHSLHHGPILKKRGSEDGGASFPMRHSICCSAWIVTTPSAPADITTGTNLSKDDIP